MESSTNYYAVASVPTRVLMISKSELLNELKNPFFRADFENYVQLKDDSIFNKDLQAIYIRCLVCGKSNHNF